MNLFQAEHNIDGRLTNKILQEAKSTLKRSLAETEPHLYEKRARLYYDLIRCYLNEERFIDATILLEYLDDLVENLQKQKKKYETELRETSPNSHDHRVTTQSFIAFCKVAQHYFASLERMFDRAGLNEKKEKSYLQKMRYRKQEYWLKKNYVNAIGYSIIELTSRYGTSFSRWSVTNISFILLFGCSIMLIDWVQTGGHMIRYGEWYNYFYFSVIAFTTAGFGDITPTTALLKFIVSIETIFGYVMLGILVSLIEKKVR